jgi:hypothetical protein
VGETLAQTFRATRAGNLIEVRVGWFCDGYATSLKHVGADGTPSDSVGSIDVQMNEAVNLGVSVLLDPPLAITPGERLALVFSPMDVGTRGYCLAYASSGDRYSDGQLLLLSDGRWMPLEGDLNFKFIVAR